MCGITVAAGRVQPGRLCFPCKLTDSQRLATATDSTANRHLANTEQKAARTTNKKREKTPQSRPTRTSTFRTARMVRIIVCVAMRSPNQYVDRRECVWRWSLPLHLWSASLSSTRRAMIRFQGSDPRSTDGVRKLTRSPASAWRRQSRSLCFSFMQPSILVCAALVVLVPASLFCPPFVC